MKLKLGLAVAGVIFLPITIWALGDKLPAKLNFSGFASLQEGQIVSGGGGEGYHSKPNAVTDHVWIQELYTGVNVQALFDNLPIETNIGIELRVGNEYPRYYPDLGKSRRLYFYPYLSRADLRAAFGDEQYPFLSVGLGYFPFKYNKEVRNLGEYLFRSGTYPQYLITEFDFPMNRLVGLHLSGNVNEYLNWNVLATTNIEWTALGDFNLSAIVSGKPSIPFIEVGAGVSFTSLFSVNDDFTSPKVPASSYLDGNGDTLHYTFAGTKLMGRATLNPQAFFSENRTLSPNDLKLYAEVAVLGVKNYPVSIDTFTRYDDVAGRIPFMFGFNWPTHPLMSWPAVGAFIFSDAANRISTKTFIGSGTGLITGFAFWLLDKKFKIRTGLDILSLEVEYFKNQYPNDMSPIVYDNQPIPLSSLRNMKNSSNMNYHKDDWKVSLYGKKTIKDHFHITFQFARDHMRWYKMDFGEMDWRETLRSPEDWAWTIKLGYSL